jgi:hypothetical protein
MSTQRFVSLALALVGALAANLAIAGARSAPALTIAPSGMTSIAAAAMAQPSTVDTVSANAARIKAEQKHEAMLSQLVANRQANLSAAVRAAAALTGPPNVPGLSVSGAGQSAFTFQGLSVVDSANVNGYDVEPPDQMLCVGNGMVLEGVNVAFAVYSERGQLMAGPAAANAFFGVDPALNVSDPRCLYDRATNRWFVTVIEYNNDLSDNHLKLAVSQTGDPTGAFNIYDINVTNDGADFLANDCPCLGDQPKIGADANGFYIATDGFGQVSYEGEQIYALSKAALAAGAAAAVVHFDQLSSLLPAPEVSFGIQPSSTPAGAQFAAGTEYLAQTLIVSKLESQLTVWTINNTQAIDTKPSSMSVSLVMVPTEAYVTPVPARQKVGVTPLAASASIDATAAGTASEQDLDGGDQRLQQVTYLNGRLWTTAGTASVASGTPVRDAAAWFVINVSNPKGGPTGSVASQGYIAGPANSHLIYPALAVNSQGRAAIVFTLTGPTYFPSAAYWSFSSPGTIHQVFAGAAAQDGFSAYYFARPRWGDYSGAAAERDGTLWLATETIPAVRDTFANWGTQLVRLATGD